MECLFGQGLLYAYELDVNSCVCIWIPTPTESEITPGGSCRLPPWLPEQPSVPSQQACSQGPTPKASPSLTFQTLSSLKTNRVALAHQGHLSSRAHRPTDKLPRMDGGQQVITRRAQARVGLLGNPSDGYNGCTISVAIANFWAEVTLTAVPGQQGVHFLRHPVHDVECWGSLGEVSQHLGRYGSFSSGIDLLKALCHVFHQHCHLHHIALPRRDGFSLAYDTNIPRQAGLSGSSAIVTAGLRCLMSWYELGPDTIPQVLQPNLVLAAEQALGITAGLQDRVAQVYGGVVFMDFTHLEQQGHGTYEHLDPACVPPLFLVWGDFPSHSGKVHANVRQRWLAGDQEVHQGMAQLADCARDGRQALEAGDWPRLANLMDTNFTIRRRLFSDQVVGKDNLHMVEVARSVGASAKLPGSGGAVIVLCSEGQAQEAALKSACEREGFQLVRIQVAPPNP